MIKNIIFDFGGVLIGWSPKNVFRHVFEDQSKMNWFLENVCTMEWNEAQDGGRTIKEAEEVLIDQHPTWEKEIKTYYSRWHEMLTGPIYGTVLILQELERKAAHRLFGLTNWSAELFPYAKKHYHFLNGFEGILVSGEEHLKKPDPAIYQRMLDKFDLQSEDCLFIDDNLRNIQAAEKFGWQVIHFSSPSQLRDELSTRFNIEV